MPKSSKPEPTPPPSLELTLKTLWIDDLRWYADGVPGTKPSEKMAMASFVRNHLTDPEVVRTLIENMTEEQREVLAAVAHATTSYFDDLIKVRYPDAPEPAVYNRVMIVYSSGNSAGSRRPPQPYDFFFYRGPLGRTFIPSDLAAMVRNLLPAPAPLVLQAADDPRELIGNPLLRMWRDNPESNDIRSSNAEAAVFSDLAGTLDFVQQGKAAISTATRMPTLPTVRQLKERLLVGDYWPENDYARTEDAIRPLALLVILQAVRWAQPNAAGGKLELTKEGQALLGRPLGAAEVKQAWDRWLKSTLLDELSRVKNVKGQQAKGIKLTKPSTRRATIADALARLPVNRWVAMEELVRYLQIEELLPQIERNDDRFLTIGSYSTNNRWHDSSTHYVQTVVSAYMHAVLWEYVATLGVIEIAYGVADMSPLDDNYYKWSGEPVSRYDALFAIKLTNLGAFVLGLERTYNPPAVERKGQDPVLRLLPNLDVVITDPTRISATDRAMLARITSQQSESVYHLTRDTLLDAEESGLSLRQARDFLSAASGQAEADFPQTVRVFLSDMDSRLAALRDTGHLWRIESDDPYLLTELANEPALRGMVFLGQIAGRKVLFAEEGEEANVRRVLKKLGYLPRKG